MPQKYLLRKLPNREKGLGSKLRETYYCYKINSCLNNEYLDYSPV